MASGRSRTSFVVLMLGTVLSLCSGSQAASASSSSAKEPITLSEECESINRFQQCWVNHYQLPSCGNEKSQTLECAELRARSMVNCDQDEVLQYSSTILRLLRTSDRILCEDKELHEAFVNDGYCWHAARACVRRYIFTKTFTYECKTVEDLQNECLEDSPEHCARNVTFYSKAVVGCQSRSQGHSSAATAAAAVTALIFWIMVISFV